MLYTLTLTILTDVLSDFLIGFSHTVIPSGAVADVNQSKAELLPRVTSDRETGSDKQK